MRTVECNNWVVRLDIEVDGPKAEWVIRVWESESRLFEDWDEKVAYPVGGIQGSIHSIVDDIVFNRMGHKDKAEDIVYDVDEMRISSLWMNKDGFAPDARGETDQEV